MLNPVKKKDCTVTFRITQKELNQLKRMAVKEDARTFSEWVKTTLMNAVEAKKAAKE